VVACGAGAGRPTLLVWGAQDAGGRGHRADARRDLPRRPALVLDGVGHVAQMERPEV
jgi:pimeloyl-ACP methyl ester carboxylesterase